MAVSVGKLVDAVIEVGVETGNETAIVGSAVHPTPGENIASTDAFFFALVSREIVEVEALQPRRIIAKP